MGKVDDVHHAPDEREPDGDERVDATDEQPVGELLDELLGHDGSQRAYFAPQAGNGQTTSLDA